MKDNKGITLVILVVIVLIIAAISFVSISFVFSMNNNIRIKEVSTNLLFIRAKVQTISEKHNFDSNENLVGEKISSDNITEDINNLISNGVLTLDTINNDEVYLLKQENLNEFGLDRLKEEDGYLVDYTNNEIIYLKGVQNSEKVVLYKLSDML